MDTKLYSEFYENYFNSIKRWVATAGIPYQEVEEVSSRIVLTILEKDGMSKYDSSRNVKITTYLNRYVFLTVKSYRQKLFNPKIKESSYSELPEFSSSVEKSDNTLFDTLSSQVQGDALEFLVHASESKSYMQARKCLSDKGWDKRRITLAVTEVRKAAKMSMAN